jgi:hypothetical protein
MGRTACTDPQCLYKGALYLTFICPNTPFPHPVYGLFLRRMSKNKCQTGSFEHVFVVTFAKRLKFAQICLTVYGALNAPFVRPDRLWGQSAEAPS